MLGKQQAPDIIFITDLLVRCIVGIRPDEREKPQDVLINLELATDFKKASQSDQIEDSLNYATLKKEIVEFTEKSRFNLIETLAEEIAKICLKDKRVLQVMVQVEKPTALRFARTVGVRILRSQKNHIRRETDESKKSR